MPLCWRFVNLHEWSITFDNIKNSGKWCPWCSKVGRCTLEDSKQFAKTKNGDCLSKNLIRLLSYRNGMF